MNRNILIGLLSDHQTVFPGERGMLDETINFVKANPGCFRRELLEGHVTGSAWIINDKKTHVLMMHHKKLGRWFQPGGHCDGDPDVQGVAAKEAWEETGVKVTPVSSAIFDVDVHVIPERKGIPEHKHYDIRFLFMAKMDKEELDRNDEANEVRWIALDAVKDYNDSESILRLVEKLGHVAK